MAAKKAVVRKASTAKKSPSAKKTKSVTPKSKSQNHGRILVPKLPSSEASPKKKKVVKRSGHPNIMKLLNQEGLDTGVSSVGVSILSGFVAEIFEHIAREAAELAKHHKKRALPAKDIEAAVKRLLPVAPPAMAAPPARSATPV